MRSAMDLEKPLQCLEIMNFRTKAPILYPLADIKRTSKSCVKTLQELTQGNVNVSLLVP